MPRSSRHKSHKQSKHKEAKDYYLDSDEDVKMKEKNSSKEETVSVRAKDSSHSASGEKRKLSSSLLVKEGKDGKDLVNGDTSEEYVSSKRRKEKAEGGSGSDRWNGGENEKIDVVSLDKEMKVESSRIDLEKSFKSKELKGSGDSKSKSSKRHESGGEKEEKNMGSVMEKEEGRSGSKSESKRKSEKESGRKEGKESKEQKEKDRGYERDKKGQESKRELEVRAADGDMAKKQASEDALEDRLGKRGRENTELVLQDESRNLELEKELEKRIRRRRESSNDRDRYQDARESDERPISSRVDRGKDGKYKDERYKDGTYGDKYQDSFEKDDWHIDEKYREDSEKHREDVERDSRRRDDKYREDGERENRRREDKYHEGSDRDDRRKDEKHREDGERDGRRRDDKYREDNDRESKHSVDKYREDGDKDTRRDDRYYEDGERDDRYRDDKYREDGERFKEDKRREEYERDGRYKDGKQGDDVDKEKRLKGAKYRDERSSRDRSGDKSDTKHTREESHVSELHSRKLNIRDGSPNYDDQGRKRTSDKEDHGDVRPRSTKDQRYESEKRSSSSTRVDLVTDRGRSSSRNADRELTPSRIRHQGSPSSVTRDHHRVSKQDEPKYREYAYEERVRHTVTSFREYGSAAGVNEKTSSRSNDRVVQKEDGHLGDLSAERRLKLDSRTSPRPFFDKSPSSTTADRRHLSRSDVRRNIDVEESGQRSCGSRDPKDYTGKEGRGSRELITDAQAGDELSQGDGDTLSISSPFTRLNHLSGSSKTLLPPLFRMTVDSPSNFGSSEDDSRMKFNNRQRRISDPSMGRVQGSPWKGVPNWPSPMASPMPNGFMPFQHGPPAVGFHPVMQQFPAPPMFGVRPSMELNHPGVPYHITDADRFSGHGRSMGWRNPVDDSIPPPLHGWDTSNTAFGDESHLYGRPDWEPGRTIPSGQGWEMSGDMWKGPKSDASMELPSASDKENQSSHGTVDVTSAGQSDKKTVQVESDVFAESVDNVHSSDTLEKKTSTDTNPTVETTDFPKLSQKDDAQLCHVYLSMLDISTELTEPELYSKCTSLISLDNNRNFRPEEAKILYIEDVAKAKQINTSSSASLFATIGDSVFQKAMTLYKQQKENFNFATAKKSMQNMSFMKSDEEKQDSEDNKAQELVSAVDETQPGDNMLANCDEEVQLPITVQKLEEVSTDMYPNLDEIVISNIPEKQEEAVYNASKEDEKLYEPEVHTRIDNSSLENAEASGDDLPASVEEVILPSNSMGKQWADRNKEETMPETKCGSLVLSEVSSKACEIEMLDSVESGSVNLSRIHHSPESTH